MSNASLLTKYLDENQIHYDTWEKEDNVFFEFQQKLKAGPAGRLLIILGEDSIVSIYALDYVTLSNTAKKDHMCKVLNDLNSSYTYFKFYLDSENNIVLQSSMPVKENLFSPELVMNIVVAAVSTMEEEYPVIMKAMWA